MEEILVIFFQLFFEFFIQVVGSGLLDGIGRATTSKREDGCAILLLHIFFGGGLGWISTLIAPKLFLPLAALRIANLIVAPLVAGAVSYLIAKWMAKNGTSNGSGHFVHGFLFALMFGLARFAFAAR
ncbi:MAG: hypothetical protein KF873_11175 [Gemmataceae bacterium]|nr:hypothetical protein [Gemmataceae bacterium]